MWFYFIASIIIPTKHLSTIREKEAFILYALLKGYKFDEGKIIESSIRCFHKNVKRGLTPHPAIITRLCIFVRPEKFQFLEKWQNRNFGYEIVISVKNPNFIL